MHWTAGDAVGVLIAVHRGVTRAIGGALGIGGDADTVRRTDLTSGATVTSVRIAGHATFFFGQAGVTSVGALGAMSIFEAVVEETQLFDRSIGVRTVRINAVVVAIGAIGGAVYLAISTGSEH